LRRIQPDTGGYYSEKEKERLQGLKRGFERKITDRVWSKKNNLRGEREIIRDWGEKRQSRPRKEKEVPLKGSK